jgi:hypothetical protein
LNSFTVLFTFSLLYSITIHITRYVSLEWILCRYSFSLTFNVFLMELATFIQLIYYLNV